MIFGAVIGWWVGSASILSSACSFSEFSVIGGGGNPGLFCVFPLIIVGALVGFWIGKKLENDQPLY